MDERCSLLRGAQTRRVRHLADIEQEQQAPKKIKEVGLAPEPVIDRNKMKSHKIVSLV